MAVTTQDVGLATPISATVTYDTVTGLVSVVTVTNAGTSNGQFRVKKGGTWQPTTSIPAGTTTVSLTALSMSLVQTAGTWDFNFGSGDGWFLGT